MTRRAPAPEPTIAAARRRLLALLDTHGEAGRIIPCRERDVLPVGFWTSEDPAEQQLAATACRACPARFECATFGLDWPDLFGTYGALTDGQRRHPTRATKEARTA